VIDRPLLLREQLWVVPVGEQRVADLLQGVDRLRRRDLCSFLSHDGFLVFYEMVGESLDFEIDEVFQVLDPLEAFLVFFFALVVPLNEHGGVAGEQHLAHLLRIEVLLAVAWVRRPGE